MAGKKNVFFLDSTGAAKVKTKYSFMLDGVGSVENNITRAKELRDGTLMVAGQAYEGNCWTYWQKLYYDSWWSPINQGSATHTSWDTAGRQGADDFLYDFTQLADGRLVFIGLQGPHDGVWTFVTDSTGKELLWERKMKLNYKTIVGTYPKPFSVCSTPDSGFTIVGDYNFSDATGGVNAFAMHFIPTPVTNVTATSPRLPAVPKIRCTLTNSTATFTIQQSPAAPAELSIFNAAGKRVSRLFTEYGTAGLTMLVGTVPNRPVESIFTR